MGRVEAVGKMIGELTSTLADEPLLGIAIVVALLAVLGGAALLVRLLGRSTGEQFARLLGSHGAVAVLMHPNPDPDAMACALAVEEIAASRETDATLYYPGQIRHHENRALQAVLDVDFERIETVEDIDEEAVVLVDHNRPRDFHGANAVTPLAVVDHHPGDGTGSQFTDVRPDNGSCASILSEYIEDLGWEPEASAAEDDEKRLSSATATALIYGIQADTNRLTKGCSVDDFHAASFLYPGIDQDKLDRIANPDMDPETLDVKARAITGRDVRSAFAVSNVGAVSNTDSIPQAADELRRLEGVNAVVVFGDKEGTIRLAGRSNDDRVHMGNVLETVLEDIPMADGGGHARMGGGQCSVEHMAGLGPGEGLSTDELRERLFAAMNGEL